MADKKGAEKGKGKSVALAKWAKIDKAQRNMFLAVCGVSIVLGVTVVSVVYFSKVIAFNGMLITEKDNIIKDYVSIQKSLDTISNQVEELRNNENLEVVARARAADCAKYMDLLNKQTDSDDDSTEDIEIELARICTALRVIPDAIPSIYNQEATLASLNQLLLWSDGAIQLEGMAGTDNNEDTAVFYNEEGQLVQTSLQAIGATLSIDDTSERIHKALDTIENSIRNYDITSANISFSGDSRSYESIELNAAFNAYYSSGVSIEKKSKKVCADETNAKCRSSSSSEDY